MTFRRTLPVGLAACLLAGAIASAPAPAGAAAPADPLLDDARGYLVDHQQADGGFEVAGFPGFETPDAILALVEEAQRTTGGRWDPAVGIDAVQAVETAGGKDPFDAIDDLVDADAGTPTQAIAARSAKLIALVLAPLGLDPYDYDPSNDTVAAVDLVDRMDSVRQPDGSYAMGAQFNGVLYAAIALASSNIGPVPAGLVDQIRAAQRDDGSWDYSGTGGATGVDVDTTALALQALHAAGLTTADADVAAGVAWLAGAHRASGAWQAYDADDPNSTSTAAIALSDLGLDPTTDAWVRRFAGAAPADPYVSPYTWLRSQQTADGNIASPSDSFGLNTFPTSQSIQALSSQWFLGGEHDSLLNRLSDDFAGGAAAAELTADDALGTNPSIVAARTAAASAVIWSQLGREAAANALFQQAFGRGLDPSGRAYWSAKLLTTSRPEVLAQLVGSAEYFRRAGSTNAGFVTAAYQTVLGRGTDAAGKAYWVSKLNAGMSRAQFARTLVASTEFRRRTVDAAYQLVLGRAPDAAGRSYWTTKLATTRVEVLLIQLASSSAYYLAEM